MMIVQERVMCTIVSRPLINAASSSRECRSDENTSIGNKGMSCVYPQLTISSIAYHLTLCRTVSYGIAEATVALLSAI